ncbi:MAG: VOC family protein [Thermoplasmata archaeon]|uniref:VOC family protein n=1 Tax=Candidatus Sysuiplasma superficiale TaxID=2823368 RepID=A0A8J7YQQ5_9ARCH|nr:VOC family protein [Candidatus Sysuiplasma superficiale]
MLRMAVFTIKCSSYREMVSFYSEKLGIRLIREEGESALFDLGGVTLELTAAAAAEERHKVEFQLETEDIEREVGALQSKGVSFEAAEVGIGTDGNIVRSVIADTFWGRYALLHDIDGNRLLITEHDTQWYPYLPSGLRK